MAFSILGAIMSLVLIVIQSIFTVAYYWDYSRATAKYELQIAILSIAAVNMILLIVSSAYSCCLCIACCGRTRKPAEQRVVFTYAVYPIQPISNQQTLGNQNISLNQHQQISINAQSSQQVCTSAPVAHTNPSFVNQPPPSYNQLDSKVPM